MSDDGHVSIPLRARREQRRRHLEAISVSRMLELCLSVETLLALNPEALSRERKWREAVRNLRVDFQPFTAERGMWSR